jgi:hypothetical protein
MFEEQRGTLAPGYLNAILQKGGEFSINTHVTYEDILYMLSGGLGVVTPTGAGPYVWTYGAPLASAWSAQSYSFEFGYDIGTVQAKGCLINKWSIKGEASAQWEATMSGFYKTHVISGSLTPAIGNRTVEVVLTPPTTLAMDSAGVTPGTTAFTNTLVSFGLDVDNGLKPVYTAASLEPTSFVYDKVMPTLTLSLLYTSAVKTYITNTLNAGLPTVIQLKTVSGTKSAEIQFSGAMNDNYTLYGDKEGAQIVELKFQAIYDTAMANYLNVVVTNGVATLP